VSRFIGFTGHHDPEVNVELLRVAGARFDTLLMPLSIAAPLPRRFQDRTAGGSRAR
jgi:hypothetical protein